MTSKAKKSMSDNKNSYGLNLGREKTRKKTFKKVYICIYIYIHTTKFQFFFFLVAIQQHSVFNLFFPS